MCFPDAVVLFLDCGQIGQRSDIQKFLKALVGLRVELF
jgi:hypothetical protein